ncbi:MAG: thioredoxin family protein [Luteibaculaceae bacterium]
MLRTFSVFLIALSLCLLALPSNAQTINWVSVNELEKLQKQEPRKVLIDVYTNWCGPCKMMEANTFSNPKVVDYVNKKYYAVKFNAEGNDKIEFRGYSFSNPDFDPAKIKSRNGTHEFTKAIAPVNGRIAYPTIVYLDEELNLLAPVQGYQTPEQIEPIIKFFGENAFQKNSYEDFSKNFQGSF